MKRFPSAAAVCVMVLALMLAAAAQDRTTGAIGGAVTDPQHAVVPGATITAVNTGNNASATGSSDANGRFELPLLQPGNYDVSVKAGNFAVFQAKGVKVEVGLVTNLNAALGLSAQSQSVEVTSQAPVVDTEQNQVASEIDQTELQNLPISARRWSNFVLATPGVAADGTFGDVSYRGLPYAFDNNTVDGASNTQAFFGEETGRTRMAYSTSLASIQEFQVSTSNYSAEYGRAAGGVVNAVTKSGTNDLHGSAYYYNRDNTVGGAYQAFATGPVQTAPGVFTTEPIKPLDLRQQLGGDFGGALIKNKLFYYINVDAQIRHFPTDAVPSTPGNFFAPITVAMPASCSSGSTQATFSGSNVNRSLTAGQVLACRGFTQAQVNTAYGTLVGLSGTVPRTGDQTIAFPKLDWHPTANQSVSVSYNRVRWASPYGVQTGSVVARGIDSQGNDYVHDDRVDTDWTAAAGFGINDARLIWSRDYEFEYTTPSVAGEPVSALGVMPQMDINGCDYAGGGSATSASLLPCSWTVGAPYYTQRAAYPNEKRFEFSDSFTKNWGNHLFKIGFDVSRAADNLNSYSSGDQFGEYSYSNLQDALSDLITGVNGLTPACTSNNSGKTINVPCYNDYLQTFGPLAFRVSTVDSDVFAQDDWHMTRNLTLNLGLRWDHEAFPGPQIPNTLLPQSESFPSDKGDVGPRAGFSWDMSGNGTTVMHGGFGVYYGLTSNEQVYGALTQDGSASGQLSPTIFPTTGSANNSGAQTPGSPVFPNVMPSYTPSTTSAPNVVYFPADYHLPGAEEWDWNLQQQLGRNTAMTISYLGSHGIFLPTGIDTNLPAPTTLNYSVVGGPANGQVVAEPFFVGPRPNSNFQKMVELCTCAHSQYDALVMQFTRRMTNGLEVDGSFTASSSWDDGMSTGPVYVSSNTPVDPLNFSYDNGHSYLNIPGRFVGAVVWQPTVGGSADTATKMLLNGWTVSFNQTAQTGGAYSGTISGNPASGLKIGGLGPTVSSGGVTGGSTSTLAWFLPKNGYAMPNLYNTDARLGRTFGLTERINLQATVEAFNLWNHVNYTSATSTAYTTGGTAAAPTLNYNSSFGALTAGNNSVFLLPRQLQFGLKLSF